MKTYWQSYFPVCLAGLVLLLCNLLAESALGQTTYPATRQALQSPAQQRMAASVRAAARMVAQHGAATAHTMLERAARLSPEGELEVYIYATSLTATDIQTLQQHGVRIRRANTQFRIVYAAVATTDLETVAALPLVHWIGLPSLSSVQRGSVTSEGDTVMRAAEARNRFDVNGRGVRVGIISDSLRELQDSVASRDLPGNVIIVNGQDGSDLEEATDEGRAMAEIVHDLAPGATLLFHSGFPTSLDFIAAIQALATEADVIVDDILPRLEPAFADGPVAQAVQAALNNGVVYVTAAGNTADRHYQGMYQEFDPHDGEARLNFHDFGAGDTTLAVSIPVGGTLIAVLQWPNPFDGSGTDDYDLLVYDASGNTELFNNNGNCTQPGLSGFCASDDDQGNTNAPPLEAVVVTNETGAAVTVTLRINRFAGAALPLVLNVNQEVLLLEHRVAQGSIVAHACVQEVLSVGAIAANDPGFNTIEPFSSQGPCRLFFPFLEQRTKPDVAAADGVMTSLPDFRPFFGTSASAPHVAAVVALLLEAAADGPQVLSSSQIADLLRVAAVAPGPAAEPNVFGYGVVDTVEAILALQALQAGTNLLPRSIMESPATNVVIVPGASVLFQGTCTDVEESGPMTFAWDFDGAAPASNLQNPGLLSFLNPGEFTVTFTCRDAAGAQAPVISRRVTVDQPPTSRIDRPATALSVPRGSVIDFAGTCSDAENHQPFSFVWFFGGGGDVASSTQSQPTGIRFDRSGTFTVTLQCIDALGIADPQPATVQVQVTGGSGGGGCSMWSGGRRVAPSPLEALGNIFLPLVVIGVIQLWRWYCDWQ